MGPDSYATFIFSTGQTHTDTFDGVMLCSGHHTEPSVPTFPGLQDGTFKGRVLHSHSYKDDRGFEDQNVLVVGIGNSGADVTVELSRTAKQVRYTTAEGPLGCPDRSTFRSIWSLAAEPGYGTASMTAVCPWI